MIGDLDVKPGKSNVSWSEHASNNVDSYPASPDVFQEIVYDDLYNFVPLTNDAGQAKVCSDDGEFCCLAEYEAEFNHQTVFSLGMINIIIITVMIELFRSVSWRSLQGWERGWSLEDGDVLSYQV